MGFKKGQAGPHEIMNLVFVLILIIIFLPILTSLLNAITSGNLDISIEGLVNALMPLIILAMFVNIIGRSFR